MERENVFETKYVNERHSRGKFSFDTASSSVYITSPLSFLYANDEQAVNRGVRLSDNLVTDSLVAEFLH